MIGMIICWYTKEHNWSKWTGQRYSDGRTYYWMRICRRCKKIESVLENPVSCKTCNGTGVYDHTGVTGITVPVRCFHGRIKYPYETERNSE